MTHLPYIAGAYGLTLLLAVVYGVSAMTRLSRVRRKLAAIDPRGNS